jgi:hypothetical protein
MRTAPCSTSTARPPDERFRMIEPGEAGFKHDGRTPPRAPQVPSAPPINRLTARTLIAGFGTGSGARQDAAQGGPGW